MAVKLNFRQKGLSKETKHRIHILCVIFVVALIIFQFVLNFNESEKNVEMADATLPIINIYAYGNTMGELHGYTQEMDACYMRDAIVPLDKNRQMDMTIHTFDYDIQEVSYEIRSLDSQRKIADTQVTNLKKSGKDLSATLQIENLVEKGEEYLFILTLKGSEQNLFYYTRIMLPSDNHQKKCLKFAEDFHKKTLSKSYLDLASYIETSPYCDKDTIAEVGIDSTLEQIGWNGFKGKILGEPLIQVTDMNEDYISLLYRYQMQEADGSISNYYNVEEYFKIRYTTEQIYLLDYNRTMTQILDANSVAVENNLLSTGIYPKTNEYLSNETGSIVSFVQNGELFEYDQNKQRFTKVYGFISDPQDSRQNYSEHDIRILNIDETGNMDFVVYGYMNRGSHEGECGINLFHFDNNKQEAIEQIFISSTQPYQILKANFSNLLYKNIAGDFYVMLGGTLAKVGLEDLSTVELIKGLRSGQYAVSSSGQYVAWIEDKEMSDTISVMDLETEKIRTIEAAKGTKIKPLAFMTDDFVYGIAQNSDLKKGAAGSDIYPMSQILIVDTLSDSFHVLKTYQKNGYYITDVSKDGYTLYLDRVKKSGGTYVDTDGDTIKDSAGEQNKTVTVSYVATEGKGSVTTYTMTPLDEDKKIRSISDKVANLAVTSQTRDMKVSTAQQEDTYFIYVGNKVIQTTQNLAKAISIADDSLGLVIDNQQRYVWKRGKKSYVNAFQDVEVGKSDASANTSAGSISAMLVRKGHNAEVNALLNQGEKPLAIIKKALKDEMVLDLTGCSLSQVLYYVSHNATVYARTGATDAVLIIGYDANSIIVYHSNTDQYARMTMEDAEKLFKEAGNVFISYVE